MYSDGSHNNSPQSNGPTTSVIAVNSTTISTNTVTAAHHDQANGRPGLAQAKNGDLIDQEVFFETLPPGIRFRPKEEELIKHYLLPKFNHMILPPNQIREVNLYEKSPDDITENYDAWDNEWYFFTPRDRKYPNGLRPKRAAGTGYWKATGADVVILDKGRIMGFKKSLVYHEGKPPHGVKTNWIMHEYRTKDNHKEKAKGNMRLDDYVLCKIYKNNKSLRGREKEEVEDADTNATSGKDSSSSLNSHQESAPLVDVPSWPVKFSDQFPAIIGDIPQDYGVFSANQIINMSIQQGDRTFAYQPPEMGFFPPQYDQNEYGDPLPDFDNFLTIPNEDDISLPKD